jgi:hypothetical protein
MDDTVGGCRLGVDYALRQMHRLRVAIVVVLALSCMGASCGQDALTILPGVANNPGNRQLRREMFEFAIDQICTEMQQRSLALKLREGDPNVGRFFPSACNVQQMATENLFVQFLGHGYAWTNVTGRMGFEASAAVEYNHDFRVHDGAMYIYFRQKTTTTSKFTVLMTEYARGTKAGNVAGLLGTSVKEIAQKVGDRILEHELAKGFTIIRESDGTVAFSRGVLPVGERPDVPFGKGESDWPVLANERTEVHAGQRDYTGPYTVEDPEDDVLWLTALVEGAPGVDVLVMPKPVGDTWIQAYERQPQAGPPPGPPVLELQIQAPAGAPGQPAKPFRAPLKLPKGSYYVVIDHSVTAGQTVPPAVQYDDRAALVSYAVQLGDPP